MGMWNEAIADQIQSTRRAILAALKKNGPLTAQDLAERLNITSMGVRRHLMTLQKDNLVDFEVQRQAVGRPIYRYRLTESAEVLFQKGYVSFIHDALETIESVAGPEIVAEIFNRRKARRLAEAQQVAPTSSSIEARLAALDAILDRDGFLAEWEKVSDTEYHLHEYNCAIRDVAKAFPQACAADLQLLHDFFPDADVQRVKHQLHGDFFCGYRITLKNTPDGSDKTTGGDSEPA